MRDLERRIEKLEDAGNRRRQPRPSLVMLNEKDEPVNEHYAEVLCQIREVEARGEDVPKVILVCPS
jgi:hypothetical protein